MSRITSELTPAAATASQYQYDNDGHRTAVIDPDGNQTSYVYDNAYRVTSIAFPVGTQNLTATYQYNGRGLVTARTLPNGVQSSYNYDSLGRTTLILHSQSGGTVIERLAYQYDAAGNPTTETSLRWDTSLGTTYPYQAQYAYDARQELTSEKYYLNNTFNLELDHTYDPAGNRSRLVTTIPNTSNSPVTINSTYQADNQIASSVRTAPLDPTQTTTYAEDGNGNLTAQTAPNGNTAYNYDFENRLTKANLPSGANVQFVYNGDGLRLQKTGIGGMTTNYVLDQLNVLLEKNSSGVTTTRYVPAVARIVGTDVRYYLEDRLGSLVALVDSTQTVTDTFRYDAWGNLLAQQGATSTPYQWIGNEGYYLNADVGFYLLGLRFYSPILGRFITRDPSGFRSGDWNQYRYVFNRATASTDPSGMLPPFLVGCAIFGATAGIGSFIINVLGSGFWNASKMALCDAAGGCLQGALLAQFPSVTAGCIGGGLGWLASQGCRAALGVRPALNPCDLVSAVVNVLLGCIGGAAAKAEDSKLDVIMSLLGFNEGAWANVCTAAFLPNCQ